MGLKRGPRSPVVAVASSGVRIGGLESRAGLVEEADCGARVSWRASAVAQREEGTKEAAAMRACGGKLCPIALRMALRHRHRGL